MFTMDSRHDFTESSLKNSPKHLHLPEPVPGVYVSLGQEKVLYGFGEDMRNPHGVVEDLHRLL